MLDVSQIGCFKHQHSRGKSRIANQHSTIEARRLTGDGRPFRRRRQSPIKAFSFTRNALLSLSFTWHLARRTWHIFCRQSPGKALFLLSTQHYVLRTFFFPALLCRDRVLIHVIAIGENSLSVENRFAHVQAGNQGDVPRCPVRQRHKIDVAHVRLVGCAGNRHQ